MKIELDEKEVKQILLNHVHSKLIGHKFNAVIVESGYNHIKGVTIEWSDATAHEAKVAAENASLQNTLRDPV